MKHPDSRDRPNPSTADFTGHLPEICNLPIQRNPNFTGRGDVLSALADNFFSDREQVFVQAIKGMGGVGKTQIALEYAYRFSSRYEAIWWVRAEDEMILAEDYALFAKAASLPERDAKNEKIVIHAVRRWLEQNRNWLVVFSNAKHPDQLSEYFPKDNTGHVLITSRHQQWEERYPSSSILFFSRNESIEFLLKRTNRKDATGAEDVAERLVDFPLALELAAATIIETNIGFSDYLKSFQTRHRALWENRNLPLTYPDTLGTTVSLACEEVEEETPAAIPTLSLFSYYGDDWIFPPMIEEAKAFIPEQNFFLLSDDEDFSKTISILIRYSLVNSANDAISLHRLVQAAVRDRLETIEQKQWVAIAVSTINGIFPSDNSRDAGVWPTCGALLSHGRTVIQHALENQAALHAAADLLDSIGSYLHARAFNSKAEHCFRQALDIFEKEMGNSHPHVGAVANNLAVLHQDQGRFEESELLFRRALEIYETQPGTNHPDTAMGLNNLAILLHEKGKNDEAERFFRRALELYDAALGPDHPDTAACRYNLSEFLKGMDKREEAEELSNQLPGYYTKDTF